MHDATLGIEILLDGEYPALWDSKTMREVLRFLRKRGKEIQPILLSRLLKEIILGPKRGEYRKMGDDEWMRLADHAIWLRLTKLKQSGVTLPKYALKRLAQSENKFSWELRKDGSEEFPFFISSGFRDTDEPNGTLLDFCTMSSKEFHDWTVEQTGLWDSGGGWVSFCDTEPNIALRRLHAEAKQGYWPISPWYDALSRYSNIEHLPQKHHRDTATILENMPIEQLAKLDIAAARWLEHVHSLLTKRSLWSLWETIWKASQTNHLDGDIDIHMTLNHASGILAAILVSELSKCHPTVSADERPSIPAKLRKYFDLISKEENHSAKLARTRLSSNLLYLFRVDPAWTSDTLLSRMDLNNSSFEPSLWEAYLWSPRIESDLLEHLKPLFFSILNDLNRIPEHVRSNAVQLFIVVAVPADRGISSEEATKVLYNLPANNLTDVIWTLKDMLRDSGNKAPTLWRETIAPWIKKVWPLHPNAKSSSISEKMAWMAMESGDAFPDAVNLLKDFLVPEKWFSALYHLEDTDLHERFPEAALTMIDCLVGKETQTAGSTLPKLLHGIDTADPSLKNTKPYQRLSARIQQ